MPITMSIRSTGCEIFPDPVTLKDGPRNRGPFQVSKNEKGNFHSLGVYHISFGLRLFPKPFQRKTCLIPWERGLRRTLLTHMIHCYRENDNCFLRVRRKTEIRDTENIMRRSIDGQIAIVCRGFLCQNPDGSFNLTRGGLQPPGRILPFPEGI